MSTTVGNYIASYSIKDADVDGLATAKKVLTVRYNVALTPTNNIYFYLLGPYQFGGTSTSLVPSNGTGAAIIINASYLLSNTFSCPSSCNSSKS